MKVLLLTGEYPPMVGGIAGYTRILADELRAQGTECLVFSHRRSQADFTVDGWTWSLMRQLGDVIRSQVIDVVHIQYQAGAFDMHPVVNLLPKLLRDTPVVTTFHDLRPPYLFPKASGVRNAAIQRMARWSAAVVVTNPADCRTLASSGINCRLIPLGSSLPIPEGGMQIQNAVGFFGYPSRQKGFETLIKAIAHIPSESRPVLLVVGSKPPETGSHGFLNETSVGQLADEYNVQISWTGFLEDQLAGNALARCGAIAFPFPHGATLRSSAMIAALQTGRPVISTRPKMPGDLLDLRSLPTLKLADPGDIAGIAQLIESSLNDATCTIDLPSRFQWDAIAASHRVLYDSVTGKLNP